MNTKTNTSALKSEIEEIKKNMTALGPMHPGSISMQYQACGNPNCKCMDPKTPRRHGPFHKLSYVFKGKTGCRFVRAACADEVIRRVAVYKEFRSLIDRWIDLSIRSGAMEFFTSEAAKSSKRKSTINKRD
ncbi:MAG: DUF6788 family protein [Patescibacteria group bacterium]